MSKTNIVLIGMPAAGKTTVGRLLAAHFGRGFIDTDEVIEARHGKRLFELIEERGLPGFRQAEEAALLGLDVRDAIIATGGSVIYGEAGMQALRDHGVVVFLNSPLDVLSARVGDPRARGMVIVAGQSFGDLYRERLPLYRRYADVEIECGDAAPAAVAERVRAALAAFS